MENWRITNAERQAIKGEGGGGEKVGELPTQSVRQWVVGVGVANGAHTEGLTRWRTYE